MRVGILIISFSVAAALCSADEASPTAQLKSETPPAFTPPTESFDYVRRTAMIPMRDGVKLYTVILIPRGAQRAPILLTRTPYDVDERVGHESSKHLSAVIGTRMLPTSWFLMRDTSAFCRTCAVSTTQKAIT